ncbi:MAG: Spo0J and IME4 domain-containing protein, partial [Halobacteriaceae archaeon]
MADDISTGLDGGTGDIIHLDPHELSTHSANIEIYQNRDLPEEFLRSIDEYGILEPVVVTESQTIISGHRRVKAARQLAIDNIPCRVASYESRSEEVLALIDYNRQREKTAGEKLREAQRYMSAQRHRSLENQQEGGRLGGKTSANNDSGKGSSNLTNASTDIRAEAAEKTGVSSGTISKGMTVLDAAEGTEKVGERVQKVAQQEMHQLDDDEQSVHGAEQNVRAAKSLNEFLRSSDEIESDVAQSKFNAVLDGKKSARDALKEAEREINRRKQKRDIDEGETPTPPEGKFDVIVADPPWPYDDNTWKSEHRGTVPYPTMSIDELMEIDVPAA